MGVNKVDFCGNVLIDLTADTVTAETLAEGVTAHGANGKPIIGTLKQPMTPHVVTEDCANASTVASYFRGVLPDGCSDALIMFKPLDSATGVSDITDRQMLTMTIRGSSVAYTRWYNGDISASATATTAYALKCWAGDEYYVYPIY